MTHDPLCPMWSKVFAGDVCDCDLIAKVRKDERKGIIGSVELAAIGQANQQAYRDGERDMLDKCISAVRWVELISASGEYLSRRSVLAALRALQP